MCINGVICCTAEINTQHCKLTQHCKSTILQKKKISEFHFNGNQHYADGDNLHNSKIHVKAVIRKKIQQKKTAVV